MSVQLWPTYFHPIYCQQKSSGIYAQTHQISATFSNAPGHIFGQHPHFYQYLKTHILIADRQFLLFLNISIQDRAQKLQIYEFLTYQSHMATFQLSTKLTTNTKEFYMRKHKQLWLLSNSTGMTSCKWTILQNWCTIPNSHKYTIMYNNIICQEWSRNRSTVFPINISCATSICTHYNHIKLLDSHFTPCQTRISFNNDLPW